MPALIIGIAQALALNPGTSRSGITMTAARAPGLRAAGSGALLFPAVDPGDRGGGRPHHRRCGRDQASPITGDAILTGALTFVVALATIALPDAAGAPHELPALRDLPAGRSA